MKTLEKHLMHFYHNMADYRDRHVFQALHHHSEINSTNWIYSLKFISDYVRMQIINIFRMGSNINIAIHKFIEVSQKVLQVPVSIKKIWKKTEHFRQLIYMMTFLHYFPPSQTYLFTFLSIRSRGNTYIILEDTSSSQLYFLWPSIGN